MILHPTTLPTSSEALGILYHSETRTISVEASTLQANGIRPGRVFDDSCDEGFTLISHRTGREIVVCHNHVERRDGDLLYSDFHPATELAAIARGAAPTVTLRIYND